MAPRTINQRIAVQGGPEVARQLSDMARAGQEAFAKIRQAAEQTKDIKLPVEQIKKQLVEVGEAGQKAFQQVGRGAKQASAETNAAAGFFSTLAGRITIAAAAAVGLATGYAAMANSASQAVVALGRQADVAKLSIESFQNLRGTLGQLNLTADESSTAMGKLRDAIKGSFDEGKKALDAFGIRFAPVREQTRAFGAEMEIFGTKFISGRTEAHRLAEAIQALSLVQTNSRTQLSETSRALLAMGAIFDPLTGKVKEGAAAWIPFAEGVRKMKDEAAQAKLVTAIFGEDIARTLLPAIRKGSDEFVKAFEGIRRLNLGFTEAERKIGQDFVNAWERLTLATKQSRTEMGLAFAPLFTPGINLLADALRRNQSAIANFAVQINKVLGPAISKLFSFLSDKLNTSGSFDALRDGIFAFGSAISQVFSKVIIPAFNTFKQAAVNVAEVISREFGTNVSPALVAVGAIIAGLLGPFKAVAIAAAALFGGQGAGFDAFRERLRGLGVDVVKFGKTVQGAFESLGSQIPGVIRTLTSAFRGIQTTLTAVADLINRTLGTDITAAGVAVVFLIGNVTGVFQGLAAVTVIVASAVAVLVGMVRALAAVLTLLGKHPVFAAMLVFAATLANVVALFQDVTREADPFQKKLEEITKAFSDGAISEAEYRRRMTELTQTQRTSGAATTDQIGKIAQLTQAWQTGSVTSQEFGRQMQQLTGSATSFGAAANSGGIAVRTLSAAASGAGASVRELGSNGGFAFREMTTAAGMVIREVSAIGTTAQQAATAAQQGLGTAGQKFSELDAKADSTESGVRDVVGAFQDLGRGGDFGPVISGLGRITEALRTLLLGAQAARDALRDIGSADVGASGEGSGGGGGGGFARGGYTGNIGARRIAGFVHGNEYVQPAHVVRQPGVLGFLELLRRTGGDLEAAIARFSRGYSMGGFVEGLNRSLSQLAIPSFASGGFAEALPARAGRDLGTIGLDFGRGGQVKVVGDEMTFDSLQRVSVRLARLSAGKKF